MIAPARLAGAITTTLAIVVLFSENDALTDGINDWVNANGIAGAIAVYAGVVMMPATVAGLWSWMRWDRFWYPVNGLAASAAFGLMAAYLGERSPADEPFFTPTALGIVVTAFALFGVALLWLTAFAVRRIYAATLSPSTR